MDLLIGGSIAFDSIETPDISEVEILGGSAIYASIAASFHLKMLKLSKHNKIGLVGAVGLDFTDTEVSLLTDRGIDMTGVKVLSGDTFRWCGRYVETLWTKMNVIEELTIEIPDNYKLAQIVLCANLNPKLQRDLIMSFDQKPFVIVDSMAKWITNHRLILDDVIKSANIVILNATEIQSLTDCKDLESALDKFKANYINGENIDSDYSTSLLVVKLGSGGAIAVNNESRVLVPGNQILNPKDPTGCGDSFIGTFAAFLLQYGLDLNSFTENLELVKQVLIHSNLTASINLQGIGTQSLQTLSEQEYNFKLNKYLSHISSDPF